MYIFNFQTTKYMSRRSAASTELQFYVRFNPRLDRGKNNLKCPTGPLSEGCFDTAVYGDVEGGRDSSDSPV